MLFELLDVLKYAIIELFQSTIKSINIIFGAIVYMVPDCSVEMGGLKHS